MTSSHFASAILLHWRLKAVKKKKKLERTLTIIQMTRSRLFVCSIAQERKQQFKNRELWVNYTPVGNKKKNMKPRQSVRTRTHAHALTHRYLPLMSIIHALLLTYLWMLFPREKKISNYGHTQFPTRIGLHVFLKQE